MIAPVVLCVHSDRFVQFPTSHWLTEMEGCKFPYGPINNMEQVFSDPQVSLPCFKLTLSPIFGQVSMAIDISVRRHDSTSRLSMSFDQTGYEWTSGRNADWVQKKHDSFQSLSTYSNIYAMAYLENTASTIIGRGGNRANITIIKL